MTEKHTPGPWRIVRDFNSGGPCDGANASIIDGDENYLAQIWCDFEEETPDVKPVEGIQPHGTAEANARLIAAAPDFLAAARIAAAGETATATWPGLEELKAAIAKAEGV